MRDFDFADFTVNMVRAIGVAALATALAIGAMAITAPKDVDYYYLSGNANMTCVQAHWTNHPDEQAFCSDDYNKALDFVARANSSLSHIVSETCPDGAICKTLK